MEPVSSRRQYYEWPAATVTSAEAAAAAAVPISTDYVSLFDQQVRKKERERERERYRVIRMLVDLGWVDFDLGVPPSCPTAQPLLPNSHQPKQN